MKTPRRFVLLLCALALTHVPNLAFGAQREVEVKLLKVDMTEERLVVSAWDGRRVLQITRRTKGLEQAVEGALVRIRYQDSVDPPQVSMVMPPSIETAGTKA